ncbi:DUF6331 family protein [Simiduia curdlanivorans]|uniref:DUF6331 family protein n=1 Tax=Simiduia curdlanivorans TaxID=1492769 RepID=A0ABV8V522_9GAMM|nr:DUF6331 family protein [Simiduia curdlanivorans]MDN3640777.1 DUF6331 family protein [Simiduia curdlanivorans]
MSKAHAQDISIGKDQWIIFEDLQNDQENAVEIDTLMEGLLPMWSALETQCVSACCGIDAYDLWEEDILKNTAEFSRGELVERLANLKNEITGLGNNVLVSTSLNNYFTKGTFLQVIEHLLKVYKNA